MLSDRSVEAAPRTITVNKNPAYPRAVRDLKSEGMLWRFSRLQQRKYLNNIVEQDHRQWSEGSGAQRRR